MRMMRIVSRPVVLAGLLFLTVGALLAFRSALANEVVAGGDDGRGILRLELSTGNSVALLPEGPMPGDVYSHYDASVGRRVWAIYEGNGKFGMAMGPGSAQPAKRIFGLKTDVRDNREALDLLRARDPKLYEEVSREGTIVFLKLHADQRWRLTRTTVPLIYNEASGERWELLTDRYIPVGHLGGYSWRRAGDRFVPSYDGMDDCPW
jgi:hypothetical protein